jgi:hypothetical protein
MSILCQSPTAGVVMPPSPLVSPPDVSSLNDVKTIGEEAVPRARIFPP